MGKLRISDNLEHKGILYLFNYHNKNFRNINAKSTLKQLHDWTPPTSKNSIIKTDNAELDKRKKIENNRKHKRQIAKIMQINSAYNIKNSIMDIFSATQKLKKRKQSSSSSSSLKKSSKGSSTTSSRSTNKYVLEAIEENKSLVNKNVSRYKLLVHPEKAEMLNTLLHPKIYLDLHLDNKYRLGRLVIQLFVEACPEIVLQFTRMCTYNMVEKFNILRIFPNLWIEGEISTNPNFLNKPKYEYNMLTLDHGVSAGIFSFTKKYLEGVPKGLIFFTISLKPLPSLNGERIPFGIVTSGLKVLKSLNEFGTKTGKLKRNFYVDDCGILSE